MRARPPFPHCLQRDGPGLVSGRPRSRDREFHASHRGGPRRHPSRGGIRGEGHLDQAIALDPGSAEAYFNRGHTYYDRAVLEEGKDARKLWFDPAAANFKKAIERDGRNYVAWDRLGLVHEQNDEREQAISDYTTEMTLHPLGKARLADAYCNWGFSSQREGNYDAAVADYEKAIQVGATPDDGCSCDPYNPLVAIYTTVNHQYDKGWDVVHKAQKSRRSIATEIVDGLKKDSGRNN